MSKAKYKGESLPELPWDWFECERCGCLFPIFIGDKIVCPTCNLRKRWRIEEVKKWKFWEKRKKWGLVVSPSLPQTRKHNSEEDYED